MATRDVYRLEQLHTSYDPAGIGLELVATRPTGNEFTVVIGPNGTGKSALLGRLARQADSHKSVLGDSPSRTIAISNLVSDSFPFKTKTTSENYRYLGLRQGSNTVTTRALTAATEAALLTLPMSRAPALDWVSLSERLAMTKPELVARRVARPRDGSGPSQEGFRELEQALWSAFDGGNLFEEFRSERPSQTRPLDIANISQRFCDVLEQFSDQHDAASLLRHLRHALGWRLQLEYPTKPSAGQEVLFSQVVRVASAAWPRALVLIDEPETALHPQWQSNFIPLLRDNISDALGMHFVIATHSPYLVGEADSIVSTSKDGFRQVFGDLGALSIDAITYKIFGASTTGSVLVEEDLSMLLEYIADAVAPTLPADSVLAAANRLQGRQTPETELLTQVLSEFEATVQQREERLR